jgi:hypothetical protein
LMKRKKQSVRSVDVNSEKVDLKLDWCSHEAAKYACEHWHYSKCMPAGKTVKIGIWENKKYIGCIIYSMGANKALMNPYGLTQFEGCELTRIALNKHITEVSRIVRISIAMLKKQSQGLRLIVSFADSGHEHIGGIYQAGNWIYTGDTKEEYEYYYAGRWMHRRSAGSLRGTISGLEKRKNGFRRRYLMPLDKEIAKQIESLRKPYPKKTSGGSVTVAQPAIQQERGGSIPTSSHNTGGE